MELAEAVEALARLGAGRPRREGRVLLDLSDPAVAEVVLDNPGARHALTVGMMEDLGRAVLRLRDWPGAAVILRASTPDSFCAGGHLGEVREHLGVPEAGRAMALAMGVVLDTLLALPQVVVAVIGGPAVGGGAELATAADHRVFAPGAWVQFRQAALGVAAGWGGVRRLVRHVPSPVALRWLSTAARVDAAAAAAAGFADAVAEDALAGARDFLAPVLALPPAGVRAVKRQLAAARAIPADRTDDVEAFAEVWGGPVHRATLDR